MISTATPALSCFIVGYERMSRHHTCAGLLELCNHDQSVLGGGELDRPGQMHHSLMNMKEDLPILKDFTTYDRYPTRIR